MKDLAGLRSRQRAMMAYATLMAMASAPFRAAIAGPARDRNPQLNPKPPRPDSAERMAAAQAKRERKAAKRAANAAG